MLLSLRLLSHFVSLPLNGGALLETTKPGQLNIDFNEVDAKIIAEILTRQGFEVESINKRGRGFESVVVGQIVSTAPHPDAAKLQICEVEIGAQKLQIVCGARKARAGLFVAVAQVGSELPGPVKIARSEIRGVTSEGMLCSRQELGLQAFLDRDGDGIWELQNTSSGGVAENHLAENKGKPVFTVLGMDDLILDVSVTPNRPDALCHEGLAREVFVGLLQINKSARWANFSFVNLSPMTQSQMFGKACTTTSVSFSRNDFCVVNNLDLPAFFIALDDVVNGFSPSWMRNQLEALDQNSISSVVDASNFVLHAFGQPSHAFDLSKLAPIEISNHKKQALLELRFAKEGEAFLGLDGKARTLSQEDCVVADKSGPQALLGVLGGESSKVELTTKSILIEFANPHPVAVRRTARRVGKKTDASFLFEKGIDNAERFRAAAEILGLLSFLVNKPFTYLETIGSVTLDSKISVWWDKIFPLNGASYLDLRPKKLDSPGASICVDMLPLALGKVNWQVKSVDLSQICGPDINARFRLANESTLVPFNLGSVERLMGDSLIDPDGQSKILASLGFNKLAIGDASKYATPSWRLRDIEGEAGLVEEIARVVGIDKLPVIPLQQKAVAAGSDSHLAVFEAISARASQLGYNEVAGFHFAKSNDLTKLGFTSLSALGEPLVMRNPILRDTPLMQTTLVPNLLRCVERNLNFGTESGQLFHVGRTYQNHDCHNSRCLVQSGQEFGINDEDLIAAKENLFEYSADKSYPYSREKSLGKRPAETPRLAGVVFGNKSEKEWYASTEIAWTFQDVLSHVVSMGQMCGVKLAVKEMSECHPWVCALHPHRKAEIHDLAGNCIGWAGEIHPRGLRAHGIEKRVIAFELNLASVLVAKVRQFSVEKRLVHALKFPTVKRDFAFILKEQILADVVCRSAKAQVEKLSVTLSDSFKIQSVHVFDVYRGVGVSEGFKSLALRVELEPTLRTLTDGEITLIHEAILKGVCADLDGEVRG